MPTALVDTRRNWSRSHRTSSWPLAPRPWGHCCRQPAQCRLCSRSSVIRSALASSARPGGNATGFMSREYSLSGKSLELLKEIAPSVTRVAVLRDAALSVGPVQFGVIMAVAPSLRVEVNPINLRDAGEIERAIAAFAGSPNGGLILTGGATSLLHSDLIITLAARHKLPLKREREVLK